MGNENRNRTVLVTVFMRTREIPEFNYLRPAKVSKPYKPLPKAKERERERRRRREGGGTKEIIKKTVIKKKKRKKQTNYCVRTTTIDFGLLLFYVLT